jgi:hypothetical protein
MKTLILATAAVLGLASAGPALAERAQVNQAQLAANGLPQQKTDQRSEQYAANGLPQQNTDQSSQVAANGLPQQNTDQGSTQLAAGGGSHPEADTNVHGTQLAESGLTWVHRSHGYV